MGKTDETRSVKNTFLHQTWDAVINYDKYIVIQIANLPTRCI